MRAVMLLLAAIVGGCTIDPVEFTPATVPVLRMPMNDGYVGLPSVARSLRPTFVWEASTGSDGISYELQLSPDASFASMVTTVTTENTSYQPDQDLQIATSPPVGTRYHWRVRACVEGACSAFSSAWWVTVGRSDRDLNGDGYADVVIGAGGLGRAYVYFGGDGTFDQTPAGVLAVTTDGSGRVAVAVAGDVNGDGFADLVVGAPYDDAFADDAGRADVYFGGPGSTFDSTVDRVLDGGDNVYSDNFGWSVASAGDVNGDGFSDIVVSGGPGAKIYLGGAGAAFDTTADVWFTDVSLWADVASAGDVNGDGFADVLIGGGKVLLYRGGHPTFDTFERTVMLVAPDSSFGSSVAGVGDVNGDGFADVVVGAPDAGASSEGNASVFLGGVASWAGPVRDGLLVGPSPFSRLGFIVAAAGDVNADGLADVLVSEGGGTKVFYGRAGPTFDVEPDGQIWSLGSNYSVASAGDVNGDGFADVIQGAPDHAVEQPQPDPPVPQPPGRAAILLGGPGAFDSAVDVNVPGIQDDDRFGSSVAVAGPRVQCARVSTKADDRSARSDRCHATLALQSNRAPNRFRASVGAGRRSCREQRTEDPDEERRARGVAVDGARGHGGSRLRRAGRRPGAGPALQKLNGIRRGREASPTACEELPSSSCSPPAGRDRHRRRRSQGSNGTPCRIRP